jgi:hypothetical protein
MKKTGQSFLVIAILEKTDLYFLLFIFLSKVV